MQKDSNNLVRFAMQAGYGLGAFWILKYLFVIGASRYPILNFINTLLSLVTPLLLFFYLIRFKIIQEEKKLKYWRGVKFGVTLFFFASIIESVIVILHIVWIDPSFISMVNEQTIELAQSFNFDETVIDELKRQSSFSPIIFVLRQILSNVVIGFILSLLLMPAVSKTKITITKIND